MKQVTWDCFHWVKKNRLTFNDTLNVFTDDELEKQITWSLMSWLRLKIRRMGLLFKCGNLCLIQSKDFKLPCYCLISCVELHVWADQTASLGLGCLWPQTYLLLNEFSSWTLSVECWGRFPEAHSLAEAQAKRAVMAGTGLGVQAWGSLGLSLRSLLGPLALVFHTCPSVLILKV